MVAQPGDGPRSVSASRARLARQVPAVGEATSAVQKYGGPPGRARGPGGGPPAVGEATSAVQKYGGPPARARDLAATLPSGAMSVNSPSSGFSATRRTRNGAPFHGAIGAANTATSLASSQLPEAGAARVSITERLTTAPASSSDAAAAANRLNRSIEPPPRVTWRNS